MSTTNNPTQFALLSRILHWLMAACLLAMLFIGVSMVTSLGNYHRLVAIQIGRASCRERVSPYV